MKFSLRPEPEVRCPSPKDRKEAKADLKAVITKQAPLRCKGNLKKAVIRHLRRIAKSPDRVKKYFEYAPVRYAA